MKKKHRKGFRLFQAIAAACLVIVSAAPGIAQQTTPQPQVPQPYTQFNFSPPGARSLGMGATFIGLADDATAAESNPAGLTILNDPEISAHFRYSSFDNKFPNLINGLNVQEFNDKVFSPSFFSLVIPAGPVAFSVYYQQAVNFKTNPTFRGPSTLEGFDFDTTAGIEFNYLLTHIGLAMAVRPAKWLSIGSSFRITRVNTTFRFFNDFISQDFGSDLTLSGERTADDSDTKVTYNLGVLLNPGGRISAGFVFKKGRQFDINSFDKVHINAFGSIDDETDPFVSTFSVPDSFGFGVSFRPTETLILSSDVVRINYSDLSTENATIDDGTEFHFGVEYIFFAGNVPLSIRAGLFTDPDHDIFPGIDTQQVHFTFGGGLVLHQRFQIDFAVNLSKTVKETLWSTVYRF